MKLMHTHLMQIIKFWIVFNFFIISSIQLNAQTYLQTRVGFGTGRYAPFNKSELDRNEHDFKYGAIIDVEIGRKYGDKKVAFLLGTRLQYNLRALKGIYTINRWKPDANINAHIFGAFLTPGITTKISNKLSLSLQANIGGSYVRWYQEGVFKDSFWVFYLPVDTSFEYQLKDKLNLVLGISVQMPIYTGTAETFFLGIRKTL